MCFEGGMTQDCGGASTGSFDEAAFQWAKLKLLSAGPVHNLLSISHRDFRFGYFGDVRKQQSSIYLDLIGKAHKSPSLTRNPRCHGCTTSTSSEKLTHERCTEPGYAESNVSERFVAIDLVLTSLVYMSRTSTRKSTRMKLSERSTCYFPPMVLC